MERFTKKIQLENGTFLNFTFTDTLSVIGPKYFVTVTDQQQQRHRFSMQEEKEGWKIVNVILVPEWITAVEKQIGEAIVDYQKVSF